MYQLVLGMWAIDYAIKVAIWELSDGQMPLTADEIANHIKCSEITVKRALPRLIESKQIVRYGNSRKGYWYEVKPPEKKQREKRHARCG